MLYNIINTKMRIYKCIKPKKRKVKNSIYKSNINKQNVKVNIMGSTPLESGSSISHMHIPNIYIVFLWILQILIQQ